MAVIKTHINAKFHRQESYIIAHKYKKPILQTSINCVTAVIDPSATLQNCQKFYYTGNTGVLCSKYYTNL